MYRAYALAIEAKSATLLASAQANMGLIRMGHGET